MNNPTTLTDPSGLGSQDACAMYFHLPSDQEHCPFNRVGALGCTIDGVNGDCGLARGLIAGGAALQCPSNVCEGVNGAGQVVSFHAFAGGEAGITRTREQMPSITVSKQRERRELLLLGVPRLKAPRSENMAEISTRTSETGSTRTLSFRKVQFAILQGDLVVF